MPGSAEITAQAGSFFFSDGLALEASWNLDAQAVAEAGPKYRP
jgi:hypothetical protein